ncbi:MAG: hypothetical protein DME68_06260 [Verrucomicrobia bacterium]|nr:MAG: hypothetical protein DME68_06260 [Verrucomicrobiota bacterium]
MNAALRAAVIAEWRGLPQKKARPDRFHTTGELLPKIMQRLGLRERLHETEVIDSWSKTVGEFIVAHSAPVALREGVLYVRVLQPALHYELEQVSKKALRRENHPRHPLPRWLRGEAAPSRTDGRNQQPNGLRQVSQPST